MGGYPRRRRSVGALILREDGWAELKPTYEYGKVYARQFVFEGDCLNINADCYGGYIRVGDSRSRLQAVPRIRLGRLCTRLFG